MDGASTAGLSPTAPRVASYAQEGLRRGLVDADGRPDAEAVKNAFEALLLTELLKPFQESLRESGLFPAGAQGDIYGSLWQTQLSELLAAQLDLLPGWNPQPAGAAAGRPAAIAALDGPHEVAVGLAARITAAAAARSRAVTAPRQTAPEAAPATESQRATVQGGPPAHLSRPSRAPVAAGHPLAARLAPFEPAIQDAASATGLEANWLRAVIIQESAGRPDAVSRKGAAGLMQLMPATAAALGVRDRFEPAENVLAGARYLRSLFERYGDPKLALAAYNAGPGRIEAYGGVPPFRETRQYVDRVLALKGTFDRLTAATGAGD